MNFDWKLNKWKLIDNVLKRSWQLVANDLKLSCKLVDHYCKTCWKTNWTLLIVENWLKINWNLKFGSIFHPNKIKILRLSQLVLPLNGLVKNSKPKYVWLISTKILFSRRNICQVDKTAHHSYCLTFIRSRAFWIKQRIKLPLVNRSLFIIRIINQIIRWL